MDEGEERSLGWFSHERPRSDGVEVQSVRLRLNRSICTANVASGWAVSGRLPRSSLRGTRLATKPSTNDSCGPTARSSQKPISITTRRGNKRFYNQLSTDSSAKLTEDRHNEAAATKSSTHDCAACIALLNKT
jgi:hypothetical protein